MIHTDNLSLSFGGKTLLDEVTVKFLPGNCYGLIGANGAGKSTFLKMISGQIEATSGRIYIEKGKRISVLSQDQFAFDEFSVLDTIIMGHKKLYTVYNERNALYAKPTMTDAEGERAGTLEMEFSEMDGYTAEADAGQMLADLGLEESFHSKKMGDLDPGLKVRVLLAQAIFGNPDILLLDEPTNQLDYPTVIWLENFLADFQNTVIVVSHDRHFLNTVCTHICDLDFMKLSVYVGNYDFWEQSSKLAMQQKRDQFKKSTDKIKELEAFVARFSANASKSKQATSRKKLIDKLQPEDIPASARRAPFIGFTLKRDCGDKIVRLENVSHSVDGERVLNNVSFILTKEDKVAILGTNSVAKTILLQILSGEITPDSGTVEWGTTINYDYFPKDNTKYFNSTSTLFDWLDQYTDINDDQFIRGLLGRMLFSGDDILKKTTVLSGGEKARLMFSKLMLSEANCLIFDEPTDHLDLETISSLNEGLVNYKGVMILTSHDFQLLNTVVNRIIDLTPNGVVDLHMTFNEYMEGKIKQRARK